MEDFEEEDEDWDADCCLRMLAVGQAPISYLGTYVNGKIEQVERARVGLVALLSADSGCCSGLCLGLDVELAG